MLRSEMNLRSPAKVITGEVYLAPGYSSRARSSCTPGASNRVISVQVSVISFHCTPITQSRSETEVAENPRGEQQSYQCAGINDQCPRRATQGRGMPRP